MKSMRPSFRKEGRDGCRKNTGFLWKQTDPSVQPIEALIRRRVWPLSGTIRETSDFYRNTLLQIPVFWAGGGCGWVMVVYFMTMDYVN